MIERFIDKDYFKDRLLTVLSASTLIFAGLGVARVLLSLQQYDYKITVRYSQYGADTFKLGDWYTLYDLAFFISITSIVAIAISMRLFKLNRSLAVGVLVLHHIVVAYFFLVANAILGTSPVTS